MNEKRLDAAQAKKNVNCKELAERYLGPPAQRAGKALQWSCPLHQDGDSPSLTVYENGYHCFGCGASGDTIDLVMRLENVGFAEAVEKLSRLGPMNAPRKSGSQVGAQASPAKVAKWQQKATAIIEEASRLLASPEGAAGRDYLVRRGFEPETWQAWQLGYKPEVQRWEQRDGKWVVAEQLGPAITLPWMDRQRPTALQYRLLGHETMRYWQQAGGQRTLYGLDHIAGRPVLLIIEGEINAISVWQAARDLVDVISFGSESNIERAGAHLQALANRYGCIIFWADKAERAVEIAKHVSCAASFKSPRGFDANDLLRAGRLRSYLQQLLRKAEAERQGGFRAQGPLYSTEPAQADPPAVQEDSTQDKSGEVVGAKDRVEALEVELEALLVELAHIPGKGMEFARPGHPGHAVYCRFCELEREWINFRGHQAAGVVDNRVAEQCNHIKICRGVNNMSEEFPSTHGTAHPIDPCEQGRPDSEVSALGTPSKLARRLLENYAETDPAIFLEFSAWEDIPPGELVELDEEDDLIFLNETVELALPSAMIRILIPRMPDRHPEDASSASPQKEHAPLARQDSGSDS